MSAVRGGARFTRERPCPICGGYAAMPRGAGKRCYGFLSTDGKAAHCVREELAGSIKEDDNGNYMHWLRGKCGCGEVHGDDDWRPSAPAAGSSPMVAPQEKKAERERKVLRKHQWDWPGGLRTVRLEFDDGDKLVYQLHEAPGGHEKGRGGAPYSMLYAEEVRAAPRAQFVFLVEGEKCADAVRALGQVATTWQEGAKWKTREAIQRPDSVVAKTLEWGRELLRGRSVVVCPDCDGPGRLAGDWWAEALATVAREVRVLQFEGREGYDVADWIAEGRDGEDLVRAAEGAAVSARARRFYGIPAREFFLQEDDEDDSSDWTVRGFIPAGMPSVIVGEPKARKTWIAEHLAVSVAAGVDVWLGEQKFKVRKGRVLFLAQEDHEKVTRRRCRRLAFGLGIPPLELTNLWVEPAQQPFRFDVPGDMDWMRQSLDAMGGADLIFVDSLQRAHRQDENSTKEMGLVLDQWESLCRQYKCSVVAVHHMTKPQANNNSSKARIGNRMRGSTALFAFVRYLVGVSFVDDSVSKIEVDGNMLYKPEPFEVRASDPLGLYGKPATVIEYIRPETLSETAQDELREISGMILTILREGPHSLDMLRKKTQKQNGRVVSALRALDESKKVRHNGKRWELTNQQDIPEFDKL